MELILIGYTIWDLDQLSVAWRGFAWFASALAAVSAGALGAAAIDVSSGAACTGLGAAGLGVSGLGAAGHARSAGVVILRTLATTVACRIVMGATMALMLFLMI